ncbi:MarR family transcriptional regulator BpsR [soil metagenome]
MVAVRYCCPMPPSDVRPPSLVGYPSYLAAQVAKSASRLLSEELAAFGVRPHHFAVLAALADFGAQCQQDLCDRLDLDKSHMVGFIDDLEGLGHVARTPDPADRRRHRVAITPAGSALLDQLFEVERTCQQTLFGMLDADDHRQLIDLLTTVVAAADARRLGDADRLQGASA